MRVIVRKPRELEEPADLLKALASVVPPGRHRRVRLHDFRPMHASQLLGANIDVRTVAVASAMPTRPRHSACPPGSFRRETATLHRSSASCWTVEPSGRGSSAKSLGPGWSIGHTAMRSALSRGLMSPADRVLMVVPTVVFRWLAGGEVRRCAASRLGSLSLGRGKSGGSGGGEGGTGAGGGRLCPCPYRSPAAAPSPVAGNCYSSERPWHCRSRSRWPRSSSPRS